MAREEDQAAPKQDNLGLLKQIQAALAARRARAPAAAEPTFDPSEKRQFARFGLDPERLQFMRTLSNLRRGMNLEQDLFNRAMSGAETPTSGGVMGDEELAEYA